MRARPLLSPEGFIRGGRPIRLGQTLWNSQSTVNTNPWGTPQNVAGTAPTGTTTTLPAGTKCYKCGIQAPRAMTPSMASLVPGGCVEVDASQCGAGGGGITSGSTGINSSYSWNNVTPANSGTPGTLPVNPAFEGPTNIFVNTFEPTERKPLPGVKVSISLLDSNWNVVQSNIASGVTDQNGQYSVQYQAPAPAQRYWFRARVSPGEGQDFPAFDGTFMARTAVAASAGNSQPESMRADFLICPAGSDPLVCDVAAAQMSNKTAYNQWVFAFGSGTDTRQAAGQFDHPRLKAGWTYYKWWIADLDILPREWPQIVTNAEQMMKIWAGVPWPRSKELGGMFERCAHGIKIYKDWTTSDLHLYVPRYSDFFPKTDEEIRRLIAYKALNSVPEIYACMEHLIEKKIAEQKKNAKFWNVVGMAAGMIFFGNIVAGVIFNLASQLKQFKDAMDFSKFMMGYQEFVEACQGADSETFTCQYLAPFVLWCMETLFMNEFYDYVAMEVGLPGAQPGLTQEQVVKPMVSDLKEQGIEVPKAAYTPGGVAPDNNLLTVGAGMGAVGVIALLVSGVFGGK